VRAGNFIAVYAAVFSSFKWLARLFYRLALDKCRLLARLVLPQINDNAMMQTVQSCSQISHRFSSP